MKRVALVVFLLLVVPMAGCTLLNKLGGARLWGKKKDAHSSPAKLMAAYEEYKTAGRAAKLWTLYSEDLQGRTVDGLSGLKDELAQRPISEIRLGNPTPFTDKLLYFNVVVYKQGNPMLEKAEAVEIEGKWFINNITPNVE